MLKDIFPLSLIISLRFLGLFIVLPILSVYALELEGSNEFLVGIVIGGYALTQMIFQVPFGMLSDKIGRKVTIFIGLVIFAIGSVICAISDDIYMLLLGRLLQGAGAIGAVVSAMISDFVPEETRAKAMAIMGGSIAGAFAIAMFAGPVIGGYYGVDKLFILTTILVFISILILLFKVPNPPKVIYTFSENNSNLKDILKDINLIKMNITNFLQKGLMSLTFLIIPIFLTKEFGWEKSELFKVYLPALILGVIAMAPSAILAEKKGKYREVLIAGIIFFLISFLIIGFSHNEILFVIGITLFFIGFNVHEPIMQSLTSKLAKAHQRGSALGVFNSFGYFGTFIGGLIGASYIKYGDLTILSYSIIVIAIGWIILIAKMENPSKRKNLYIDLKDINKDKISGLNVVKGIIEHYINESENRVIIKYNEDIIEEKEIKEFFNG